MLAIQEAIGVPRCPIIARSAAPHHPPWALQLPSTRKHEQPDCTDPCQHPPQRPTTPFYDQYLGAGAAGIRLGTSLYQTGAGTWRCVQAAGMDLLLDSHQSGRRSPDVLQVAMPSYKPTMCTSVAVAIIVIAAGLSKMLAEPGTNSLVCSSH
jgi:hypothetical protein